jgi:hypothetical protein
MIFATVHEPPDPPVDRLDRAETLAYVGDRFSFAAALLGPLWMLAHRLWLGLLLYVGAAVAIVVAVTALGLGGGWLVLLLIALNLIVGFEAASLRRWALERRGWLTLGTVSGRNLEDCERRFLGDWLAEQNGISEVPARSPRSSLAAIADGEPSDALGRRRRGWLPWSRR